MKVLGGWLQFCSAFEEGEKKLLKNFWENRLVIIALPAGEKEGEEKKPWSSVKNKKEKFLCAGYQVFHKLTSGKPW